MRKLAVVLARAARAGSTAEGGLSAIITALLPDFKGANGPFESQCAPTASTRDGITLGAKYGSLMVGKGDAHADRRLTRAWTACGRRLKCTAKGTSASSFPVKVIRKTTS